tara:strand:+ start:702 stop:893 length:192 start_codon:yes stop_codon:yes gene_type:complete
MANKKVKNQKYKANPRFFEWIAEPGGVFQSHWEDLKKGNSVDLSDISEQKLQYCLDNDLITQV